MLLVLLIIFMVIQPTTVRGLEALAPVPPTDLFVDPDPQTIVVQVSEGAGGTLRYRINETPVAAADLTPTLSRILARRNDRVLFIRGEPRLDYGAVLTAIDAGHAAGATSVGVLTQAIP